MGEAEFARAVYLLELLSCQNRLLREFKDIIDQKNESCWLIFLCRKQLALFCFQSELLHFIALVAEQLGNAFFAHKIALGGMQQTADAFGTVQGALSFFVERLHTVVEGLEYDGVQCHSTIGNISSDGAWNVVPRGVLVQEQTGMAEIELIGQNADQFLIEP